MHMTVLRLAPGKPLLLDLLPNQDSGKEIEISPVSSPLDYESGFSTLRLEQTIVFPLDIRGFCSKVSHSLSLEIAVT